MNDPPGCVCNPFPAVALLVMAVSSACSGTPAEEMTDVSDLPDATTWQEALADIGQVPVAYYSYAIGVDNNGAAMWGLAIRLQASADDAGCPTEESEFHKNVDGWVLYVRSTSKTAGEYSFVWETSAKISFQAAAELNGFSAILAFNADGFSERSYEALSGTLQLDTSVVDYEQRDDAQPLTGTLTLDYPVTSVDALACTAFGDVATGAFSESCQCLLDDERETMCVPLSEDDECCAREVDGETAPFTLRFEARPCTGLCEAYDHLLSGFCQGLIASDFDSY